ncbi:MAG: sulfide/dihydroorotate dehydrogenase-like FAD/NAD-binding protein [Candidatus Izemoplasmatales bacterium]
MYEIINKKKLNNDVDLMVIHAPLVAKNTLPGNFVIIRVNSSGERIPLTIVENDKETITIISQKVGFTTKLLGEMKIGDSLEDVVGPLGLKAEIKRVNKVIGIAGGVGAAPLYPQLKAYHDQGTIVDLVIGAQNKEHLLLLDKFEKIVDNIYICTDDGSLGTKGFVTNALDNLLKYNSYDLAIAIGPLIMMKNVVELNKKHQLKTYVSLNPIMIDGTGMCGNCRVSINGKTYFACVDGPDFPGEGIDFDELIHRQTYYKKEEHICNLRLGKKDD